MLSGAAAYTPLTFTSASKSVASSLRGYLLTTFPSLSSRNFS